jgi:outer membrane protein TolC
VPALREAEAQEGVARERARARALEVGTQVLDARGRVEAARAALLASTSQRTLGAEVARVEKLKFDAGTGRIEDYLLALAQQFDAEAAAWQARYSLQTALDYLVLATGTGGSR